MKRPFSATSRSSTASVSGQAAPPSLLSLAVVRPDDLLALVFHLVNISIEEGPPAGATSSRKRLAGNNQQQAYIIVEFASQSVGEQSFFEADDNSASGAKEPQDPKHRRTPEDPVIPAAALYSGPSWLVYQIPREKLPIPFELGALLQLCLDAPQVVQTQQGNPVAPEQMIIPHAAFNNQDCEYALPSGTAIEAPFRLYLSPGEATTWQHATAPEMTTSDGKPASDATQSHRSVLWHTRLQGAPGLIVDPGGKFGQAMHPHQGILPPTARAVWDADLSRRQLMPPPYYSLEPWQRWQLMQLTTPPASGRPHIGGYTYPEIGIEQLWLSAMGAWLKAHWTIGNENPPKPFGRVPSFAYGHQALEIVQWDHEISMGRDQFVRVVTAGYLMPFAHDAVLVTITQRRFAQVPRGKGQGQTAAFLKTHQFIIVREPIKTYDQARLPFTKVVCKTLMTPNILPDPIGSFGDEALWIKVPDPNDPSNVDGIDFQFHLEATDKDGQTLDFTAPLAFVGESANSDPGILGTVMAAYRGDQRSTVNSFGGAAISFVPARSDGLGDGRLETENIHFSTETDHGTGAQFRPILDTAQVAHPATKRLTGNAQRVTVAWENSFVDSGGNNGDVYLSQSLWFQQQQPTPDSARLAFADSTRAGGLLTPNLSVNGFSRLLGPVSLPSDTTKPSLVDGSFSPKAVLSGLGLKLLGAIDLADIFADVMPGDIAQQMRNLDQPQLGQPPSDIIPVIVGSGDTTRWVWETTSFNSTDIFQAGLNGDNAHFRLETVIVHQDGKDPTFSAKGTLEHFAITLPKGDPNRPQEVPVTIPFKSFTFTAGSGQKLDVSVDMGSLVFGGALSLIQNVLSVIPLDGFVDPPFVDVETDSVTAGYKLAIPTISMGYFTLQNISLDAEVFLPFLSNDEAHLGLDFCTRDKPFMLTVSGLGGGGYCGVTAGLSGIQTLELSLDFGASVALNLGVAAGSVSVVGGVYIQMTKGQSSPNLTAFVRANGELDVLGLITISACLYIGLNYENPSLSGDAELDVSISIAFFSTTVPIKMHREFKGSDPIFLDTYTAADWQDYCEAFAS